MKTLIYFFTLLLELSLFFQYDLPIYYTAIYILTIIEVFIVCKKNINFSVAGWWLYIYIVCSFLVIACFKFTPSRFTRGVHLISGSSFYSLAETSIYVMFFYFLSVIILCRSKFKAKETNWTTFAPKFNIAFVFILGFSLTLISYIIGIGKMGVENNRLPFHLSGIIQFCRTDLIPVMALCIYANRKKQGKNVLIVLALLFGWSLFETVVRLSKSAIIFSFLPIIMYELLSSKKNLYLTLKPFIPVLFVVIILYPVIEVIRSSEGNKGWNDSEDEISGTFENPTSLNYLVKPFNRTFLTGYLYCEDESTVDPHKLFDFNQLPLIIIAGGSARYQTFVIDGYPEGISHSSGTSPFIDSMLVGGFGLLYISIFIMVFLAELLDRKLRCKYNYIIIAILCVAYYRLFDMPLFTFFLNEMSIRYLLVYAGICLYISYRWRKYKNNIR